MHRMPKPHYRHARISTHTSPHTRTHTRTHTTATTHIVPACSSLLSSSPVAMPRKYPTVLRFIAHTLAGVPEAGAQGRGGSPPGWIHSQPGQQPRQGQHGGTSPGRQMLLVLLFLLLSLFLSTRPRHVWSIVIPARNSIVSITARELRSVSSTRPQA